MMLVSFLSRQRRALVPCAAAVLLHVLALWWVLPQLGRAGADGAALQNAPVVARLLSATAPAEPVPRAQAEPARRIKSPALAARRPPMAAAPAAARASAAAPSAELAAPEQDSASASADPGASDFGASDSGVPLVQPGETAAPVLSAAGSAAEPVTSAPAESVATPPPARRYKVNLPPSAQIVLGVERRDADGTLWHGEAAMAWTLQGERYTMKVSAGIRLLIARVDLLVLESEGTTGEHGFAPATMTEQRRGRALTATHFNARDGLITFSASTASFALLPGAQDKASLPLQLAAIARADSAQLDGGIEILVGGDKDASVYRFEMLGEETLDTGLGKMAAWHLSRPPRAGAYGARLDIWLAPGHGWYPVQIRNIEANGAVTTQTVKQIVMTEAGS